MSQLFITRFVKRLSTICTSEAKRGILMPVPVPSLESVHERPLCSRRRLSLQPFQPKRPTLYRYSKFSIIRQARPSEYTYCT